MLKTPVLRQPMVETHCCARGRECPDAYLTRFWLPLGPRDRGRSAGTVAGQGLLRVAKKDFELGSRASSPVGRTLERGARD